MKREDVVDLCLCVLAVAWFCLTFREVGPYHVVSRIGGRVVADYWTNQRPAYQRQEHSWLLAEETTNVLQRLIKE